MLSCTWDRSSVGKAGRMWKPDSGMDASIPSSPWLQLCSPALSCHRVCMHEQEQLKHLVEGVGG